MVNTGNLGLMLLSASYAVLGVFVWCVLFAAKTHVRAIRDKIRQALLLGIIFGMATCAVIDVIFDCF